MRSCIRCLYSTNHPLNLTLDEHGVCSGCRVHEEKDLLDWKERGERLRTILSEYRNRSGRNYDCIVPVSGGRDSYFIVHTIKNVYGMNPLLVTYNKHYNTAVGIRNLANLRIRFGCDIMTLTVSPDTVKKITRSTLRRFGSIYWHCIAGQTVFPVQLAVRLKIPLIVWGAHQGIDQVGMFSHLDEVEMTRKYRKEHDLMGYEAEDLIGEFDNVTEADVVPFIYPDSREIENVGVRGIYLNNYIRWDSRLQHEEMIRLFGYETQRQTRTFDSYNDVDCWNYSDLHDYIKWIKLGYGKAIDHASRDIRLGHMTRAEGSVIATEYLQNPPQYLSLFLKWLGMTENSFFYVIDQHRNPNIWQRDQDWQWRLRDDANLGQPKSEQSTGTRRTFCGFQLTDVGRSTDASDRYILVGKGAL